MLSSVNMKLSLILRDFLEGQRRLVELSVVDALGDDRSISSPSASGVTVRSEREAASTPSASEMTALSLNCGFGPS